MKISNAKYTVDEKIVKALRKKINIASEVLGEELKSWIQQDIHVSCAKIQDTTFPPSHFMSGNPFSQVFPS